MKRSNFLKSMLALPFVAPLLSSSGKKLPVPGEEVVFTEEMLSRHNYGLFIIDNRVKQITEKNVGYAATVSWKLGWHLNHWRNSDGKRGSFNKYGKMNFLTDGWFSPMGDTYEEVCEYLNNNPHGQRFRLMSKEEVLFIISHRQQGFL
jgi:hypothetical protein